MSDNKQSKALALGLVRACQRNEKPVYIEFEDLRQASFEIPGLIAPGEELLYIKAEDFIGVVPREEYAVQKKKPGKHDIGRSRGSFVHSEYELVNPDGSKNILVVFSTKAYDMQFKGPVYDEIESSEFVTARVVNFTEYGAILIYKGVMLELSDGSFSKKSVPCRSVLEVGEEIDVRFRKYRNRKQKIIVEPVIPFPTMSYHSELDPNSVERGQILNAEINKITATNVTVTIGRKVEGGKNTPIRVVCRHPHPAIAQYLATEIPVRVKILQNKEGDYMRGSIEDINRDFVDDHIFEYRRALEEYQQNKEVA